MVLGRVLSRDGWNRVESVRLRHRLRKTLMRLALLKRDSRGVTIVEFGFVAIPLVATILAAIQTTIMLFTQQALETTSEKVARQIMTGQAQAAKMNQTQFKAEVCKKLPSLIPCSAVMVDVAAYSAVSMVGTANPTLTYSGNNVTNSWDYDLGEEGEIVRLRIMYLAPSAFGPLGFTLADQKNGKRLLVSTSVFRNESS
jgi:Flp pilus assembly pilin Flp